MTFHSIHVLCSVRRVSYFGPSAESGTARQPRNLPHHTSYYLQPCRRRRPACI